MIFWKRLILVWNILLIQVWNCTPLESWNLADTEVREQMLKGDDLKGLLILDPVKQKNDWKSMIGSVNYLEKDYAEIDTHKFEGKNWKPIEEMIVGLNSCHNKIHHIFGTPDHETNNSWDKKPQWDSHVLASALDDYHGSIWEIFSILKIPCKVPTIVHHLWVAGINCILETLLYIHKYNLADSEIMGTIQSFASTPDGLNWFIQT
ncbi:hypothetical protein PGT21_020176 [Puccinia graminis f. sp. tritici]|uniref:Protein kinase domain-containing protein n=1 Tax=Puccinia graminis f. sp. tritici TaxID=56615 RepID=A0A5B0LZ43_PUCGR|nr:hypothetical protein PGT21_020176 [Puccinia graminis f. sp. tritici]